MSKENGDLIDLPWLPLAGCIVMGILCLWTRVWLGAVFFLGAPALLLTLAVAVSRGWLPGPAERWDQYYAKNKTRIEAVNERVRKSHPHYQEPHPELSARKKTQTRKAIALLSEHGIFQPERPPPDLFFASLASNGFPIKPDAILSAFEEIDSFHPEADVTRWNANLTLHESHVEQLSDTLERHILDLERQSDGLLQVENIAIVQTPIPSDRWTFDNQISYTVNGTAIQLDFRGDGKYLSTVIHHDLAKRLAHLATGKRFAWLWVDEGVYISLVADDTVDLLNAAFKLHPKASCIWEWVDEALPIESGFPFGNIVNGNTT